MSFKDEVVRVLEWVELNSSLPNMTGVEKKRRALEILRVKDENRELVSDMIDVIILASKGLLKINKQNELCCSLL